MRIDASHSRSPIGAIITELFSGSEGKTLNAVVASIKGEMILLVFNQKTPLQARAKEPLLLKEGQRVELMISSVTDEEIQLSIVDDCTGEGDRITLTVKSPFQAKPIAESSARPLKGTEVKAVVKGLNDSTSDSAAVRTAVKEIEGIIRYKERLQSLDGVELEELLNMPLKKLYDLAAAIKMKGRDPHEGLNANIGLEKRGIWLLQELEGVKPEDIARLVRLDRELNVFNLIIARTVREGKDFIKPLLRELMRYNEANTDKESRTAALKDDVGMALVEKFEYGKVVGDAREKAMAKAVRGTTLRAVAEKASRLSRAFASKDCFIIPLLYNGECEEALALIKRWSRNKASGREDSLQAEVELVVRLSNLGEVRAVLSIMDKEVALRFFAEKEDTVRLIDENKGIFVKRAGEKGYNIIAVSSSELKRELFHFGDATIDLRV